MSIFGVHKTQYIMNTQDLKLEIFKAVIANPNLDVNERDAAMKTAFHWITKEESPAIAPEIMEKLMRHPEKEKLFCDQWAGQRITLVVDGRNIEAVVVAHQAEKERLRGQ